jgi:hypothetical protein
VGAITNSLFCGMVCIKPILFYWRYHRVVNEL